MPLTDAAIRNAKPKIGRDGKPKARKLFDATGLYLLVTAKGSRLWRYRYRYADREKLLALGKYPMVSLADVRERHFAARRLLEKGIDPSGHRQAMKAAQVATVANSFETVAREWLATKTFAASTRARTGRWLEKDIFPYIGAEPVDHIKALTVRDVLDKLVERGAVRTAHRLRNVISQIMRYAVATGRAEHDPAAALKGALRHAQTKHYAAILDPARLGEFLRAVDAYKGETVTRAALKLLPLLFVRPGELREAEWAHIDFAEALWTNPGEKMKKRKDHLVPLAPQALGILRELHRLTGRGRFVFPSPNNPGEPLSSGVFPAAFLRMGYSNKVVTAHGFRATAKTLLLERLEQNDQWIERQLAHAPSGQTNQAYDRTLYLPQRRQMMALWADYLDTLRTLPDATTAPESREGRET